ncbi:MAG: protein kinase [Sandaracinaceae bacterium]|nr:protein kinase [Sandaracinaceae bacterium]
MENASKLEELIAKGAYDEAIQSLIDTGAYEEAASLCLRLWRFEEAVEYALRSSKPELAYAHALRSRDPKLIERAICALSNHPQAARRAAQQAEIERRWADAGALWEKAGELERALALYEQAGELAKAAQLAEKRGEWRQAGMLYERWLDANPEDEEAAIGLARILLAFGKSDAALARLQACIRGGAPTPSLLRWLFRALLAQGLEEAARETLRELRRLDPTLPSNPHDALSQLEAQEHLPRIEERELLLGRYRPLAPLGAGATGRVFRALDLLTEREVAIKILNAPSPEALRRFEREAKLGMRLDHPHILRILHFDPSAPLIAMELMKETLAARLRPGEAMPPLRVKGIALAILSGLSALHRAGVIHRDLKPENIFFNQSGVLKIGDLGTAHLIDTQATLTGAMMGSLPFMAPELIHSSIQPCPATDIYSFGVILFRLLVGRLPFPGPDFITQHLNSPIPSASALAPWLPPSFDYLFQRLLAKNPDSRPQSAQATQELIEDLPFESAEDNHNSNLRKVEIPPLEPDPPPPQPIPLGRYTLIGSADYLGVTIDIVRDTLLDRKLWSVRVPRQALPLIHRFARVLSPFIQCVIDIDDESGLVLLEAPLFLAPPLSKEHLPLLLRALDLLHHAGLSHGSIDRHALGLSQARPLLLLPLPAILSGSWTQAPFFEERKRLEALFQLPSQ